MKRSTRLLHIVFVTLICLSMTLGLWLISASAEDVVSSVTIDGKVLDDTTPFLIDTGFGYVADDGTLLASYTWAAQFDPYEGVLTLRDYDGGPISTAATGDLTVNALSVSEGFNHKASTGKAKITDLTCKNFSSEADTGYITLSNVIASEILSVKRSTGDVNLNGSDGSEILIDTDTGDVKGTILTSKIFIIDTSTGKVNVPESLTGGKCKVTTSTGDVKLDLIG